jgi:hypothetical protein
VKQVRLATISLQGFAGKSLQSGLYIFNDKPHDFNMLSEYILRLHLETDAFKE